MAILTKNGQKYLSPAPTGPGGDLLHDNMDHYRERMPNGGRNVQNYGAVGDGSTDDSAAFAAALVAIEADKQASATYDSGFRGFVPTLYVRSGGRYVLSSADALTPVGTTGSVSLRGLVIASDGPESAEILCDWNTDDWLCNNVNQFAFSRVYGLRVVAVNGVERGFNLESTSGGRVQGITFDQVSFINFATAVRIAGTANSSENRFYHCKFDVRAGQVGIWLDDNPQAVNNVVRDSEMYVQGGDTLLSVSDANAAGTTTLGSTGGTFTSAMVGKKVFVAGQGQAEIVSLSSGTAVVTDKIWGTFSGATATVWDQGIGILCNAGGELLVDSMNLIVFPGGLGFKVKEVALDGGSIADNNGTFQFLNIKPELRVTDDDPGDFVATDARTYGRLLEISAFADVSLQGNLNSVQTGALITDAIRMHRTGNLRILANSRIHPHLGFTLRNLGIADYVKPWGLNVLITDSILYEQLFAQVTWDIYDNWSGILSSYGHVEARGCDNGTSFEPVDVALTQSNGNIGRTAPIKVYPWRLAPSTSATDGIPTPTTSAAVVTTNMTEVPRGCTVRKFTIVTEGLGSQNGKGVVLTVIDKDDNVLCTQTIVDGDTPMTTVSSEIRYRVDSDAKRQFRLRATNPGANFVDVAALPGWVEMEWV